MGRKLFLRLFLFVLLGSGCTNPPISPLDYPIATIEKRGETKETGVFRAVLDRPAHIELFIVIEASIVVQTADGRFTRIRSTRQALKVEKGEEVSTNGYVYFPRRSGFVKCVEVFIDQGADINGLETVEFGTVFHTEIRTGNEVLTFFVQE